MTSQSSAGIKLKFSHGLLTSSQSHKRRRGISQRIRTRAQAIERNQIKIDMENEGKFVCHLLKIKDGKCGDKELRAAPSSSKS